MKKYLSKIIFTALFVGAFFIGQNVFASTLLMEQVATGYNASSNGNFCYSFTASKNNINASSYYSSGWSGSVTASVYKGAVNLGSNTVNGNYTGWVTFNFSPIGLTVGQSYSVCFTSPGTIYYWLQNTTPYHKTYYDDSFKAIISSVNGIGNTAILSISNIIKQGLIYLFGLLACLLALKFLLNNLKRYLKSSSNDYVLSDENNKLVAQMDLEGSIDDVSNIGAGDVYESNRNREMLNAGYSQEYIDSRPDSDL